MNLYIVIIEDRHADVEAEVFDTSEAAIAFAKESAKEIATSYGEHPEREAKEESIKGWLYAARCSPEADYVHVIERVLNQP